MSGNGRLSDLFVRTWRVLRSAVTLFRDAGRLGAVIALGDAVFTQSLLDAMVKKIGDDPTCAEALRTWPRLGPIEMAKLRSLPAGTLGRSFAEHVDRHGIKPEDLPVRPATDPVSYARAHLLETHDIWHTLTNFSTDTAGELGLHGFYLAQMPTRLAPLLIGGGILQSMRFGYAETDIRLRAVVRGWLMGKRAKPLFGIKWAELWEVPLVDVRARYCVDPDSIDAMMPHPGENPAAVPAAST
jgi:ubiquinone biosynthesis protein COQ4